MQTQPNSRCDSTPTARRQRRGERGAALITALLLSTMLLTAGGALLMTTTLSATNAFESTPEIQAYYAAEAGMQASLAVLRNVSPAVTFTAAVTPSQSNATGDAATVARLSKWVAYGSTAANSRVTVGSNAYSLSVTDPDSTSPVNPSRLLIKVTGYGPRGAAKQLELMVANSLFNFQAPATITVRGADSGSTAPLNVALGDCTCKVYSGADNANPSAPNLPAFASTNADTRLVANAIAGGVNAVGPRIGKLSIDTTLNPTASAANAPPSSPVNPTPPTVPVTPSFLQTADNARALVSLLKAAAQSKNRYFTTWAGGAAAGLTFIDGNATVTGGSGLLVVTGNLLLHENSGFTGLVLVLGNGSLSREGGGPSNFYGSIVVAKFNATGGFLAPTYSTQADQGNTVRMQYDSSAVRSALATTGLRVLGIVEK